MKSKPALEQIQKDLFKLKEFQIVLFGSYASGQTTPRSDIDIAIITSISDPEKNKEIYFRAQGKAPPRYDLKVFELLPLDIKAAIMETYIVLFGDPLEISEYFHHFRRLWNDVRHRYYANQFTSVEEKMNALRMA